MAVGRTLEESFFSFPKANFVVYVVGSKKKAEGENEEGEREERERERERRERERETYK